MAIRGNQAAPLVDRTDRGPSRPDRLRVTAVLLALVGASIAGYLTYVHYAGIDPVCKGGGGCGDV